MKLDTQLDSIFSLAEKILQNQEMKILKYIEEALHVEPKSNAGTKGYHKLMMFKILILQRYYNLSDEQQRREQADQKWRDTSNL